MGHGNSLEPTTLPRGAFKLVPPHKLCHEERLAYWQGAFAVLTEVRMGKSAAVLLAQACEELAKLRLQESDLPCRDQYR